MSHYLLAVLHCWVEVMLGALPLVIPDLTKVPELMDRCLLSDRSLSLTISDMLQ